MSDVIKDLRIEIRKVLEGVWELDSEEAVRDQIGSLNSLIVRRQMGTSGVTLERIPLLQVEDIVSAWREKTVGD